LHIIGVDWPAIKSTVFRTNFPHKSVKPELTQW
jgi:hypothetical protein